MVKLLVASIANRRTFTSSSTASQSYSTGLAWTLGFFLALASASAGDPHWAYEPLLDPQVPSSNDAAKHPIDAFVTASHTEGGLVAGKLASPRTRIRRLTWDLLGLPTDYPENM